MSNPYLTEAQYRALLVKALGKQGMPPEMAMTLILSRYPMFLASMLAECVSRGIELSEADVDEFLWDLFDGPPKLPSGEPVEVTKMLFVPELVEALLEWASWKSRGKPSVTSEAIANLLAVAEEMEPS